MTNLKQKRRLFGESGTVTFAKTEVVMIGHNGNRIRYPLAKRRVGHNGGPTTEPGFTWRKHCWQRARAALPHIPGDRVILIARTALERAGCAAGWLAACLPADRYFVALPHHSV